MSVASLLARMYAGEFDREKRPPATAATAPETADVSVKPAPVLACTSATSATAQNDNPQSEPGASHYGPLLNAHSHFRLPNGTELWLSPSESMEQVQSRHPGAVPIPEITEPGTEAEQRAIEYCERVAKDREAGRIPVSYTATTHCRSCGTVWIFQGAPARVDSCPWCSNRTKGLPIPRPSVSCATCQHFTADPIGDGGIGSCAKSGPPKGQMPAYPHVKRQCSDFEPKETTQ